jgi:hypothetical protein
MYFMSRRYVKSRLMFGLECRVGAKSDPLFLWDSQLPTVLWQYCVPLHCAIERRWNWRSLLSAGLRHCSYSAYVVCLWQSWTACLRTESFIQPFGLQELRIFLGPIFSLGCDKKNSVYSNNPHKIDDLKMVITEYIRNVDRDVLNTVFEKTVRCVSKCLETGGGHFEYYL